MNQLLTHVLNLSMGQAILIACCVLLSLFIPPILWQMFSNKEKKPVNEKQEIIRQDPFLGKTLNRAEQLESILNEDLESLKMNLQTERIQVNSTAQALKTLAQEKKFPETLYQIYLETKNFPIKSKEGQASDMEWHRKVGISDLDVQPLVGENGIVITFVLLRHLYKLYALQHAYARISFVELVLKAGDESKLMVARAKPEEVLGRVTQETAVMEMRNGGWVDDILSCRLLMDKRQMELDLLTEHRQVEQLKSKFVS